MNKKKQNKEIDIQLYNDDCFNVFNKIEENKIDLVLVDLPYNQTSCDWDISIDLEEMWIQLKRICKKHCIYCFFTTTKYGIQIINSNPKWFRYDLVWEKSKKVGFLTANKMPLRKHEMIYIFCDNVEDKKGLNRDIMKYSRKLFKYINKTKKEIKKDIGDMSHFFTGLNVKQFRIPTEKKYKKMIEIYNINKLDYFLSYKELKKQYTNNTNKCYNPQMEKGKPYKTKGIGKIAIYNRKRLDNDNKGTRHPISILRFNNPKKTLHPTQKPVNILEWLIKTYSNEGDYVLDFCMGSGSTGIACINTKRNFIGIEKEKKYFDICKKRFLK